MNRFLSPVIISLFVVAVALADHPTAPVCGGDTASFDNLTVTPLTDAGVVTSTITVSGLDTYLWDLDLTTLIDHTNSNDLDITLTSPSGTVVTVTTDNGGANDNVFAGTVWDNDANPAGTMPYTSNTGVVTDNVYADLTAATPLTPEESFGAFKGEDPNGIWTLSISDDTMTGVGTLNSWSMSINHMPAAPVTNQTTFTDSPALAIPDGPGVVSTTMNVSGLSNTICDLDVLTNITHTFAGDLDIALTSPAGTTVTLTTDNGSGADNVFNGTVWDDEANPGGDVPYTSNNGLATDNTYVNLTLAPLLAPEEPFAAFDGEDPNGIWTITISDDAAGDSGVLADWELRFTTCTEVDTDGDTFGDTCDGCPADADKQAPGACGCGVSDVDLNMNMVPDCLDPTPTPTPTPTSTPTPVPTSTPTNPEINLAITAPTVGRSRLSAPTVTLSDSSVSRGVVQGCFDFKRLRKNTANVFFVLRNVATGATTRTRIRKAKPCGKLGIRTPGDYEAYVLQTRSDGGPVLSKKVAFTITGGQVG